MLRGTRRALVTLISGELIVGDEIDRPLIGGTEIFGTSASKPAGITTSIFAPGDDCGGTEPAAGGRLIVGPDTKPPLGG
jgi:hypothetical protein